MFPINLLTQCPSGCIVTIRPRRSFSMNCVTYFGTSSTLPVVFLFFVVLYFMLFVVVAYYFSFVRDFGFCLRALCFTIFFFAGCAYPYYSSVRIIDGHIASAFSMADMYARVAFNQVSTLVACHAVVPSFPSPVLHLLYCSFGFLLSTVSL